jgi:hypothetical protein
MHSECTIFKVRALLIGSQEGGADPQMIFAKSTSKKKLDENPTRQYRNVAPAVPTYRNMTISFMT